MTKVSRLAFEERSDVTAELRKLEQEARYPLGSDFFRIDHGPDPFAFFDRMGEVSTWVACEEEKLVGLATGVLRRLTSGNAWYVCDLKVAASCRRQGVARAIGLRAIPPDILRCRRGYGVAMDPDDGEPPTLALVRSLPRFVMEEGPRLNLYSLSLAELERAQRTIEDHRGVVTVADNFGTKDIVVESTGRPLALFHLQFGPLARADSSSVPAADRGLDATYMFCTPQRDALDVAMAAMKFRPSASAHVIHRGMGKDAFDWLLTSDI